MSATIARTISTVKAWAISVEFDENDNPVVTKSEAVEFQSTNPSAVEGMRALKEAGIKCKSKDVRIEVVSEAVYAMTLDDFIEQAKVVERAKGGYIRKSDLADDTAE